MYDRLNVFHVVAPPLRHRKEEIPALVKKLLAELCEKAGLQEIPEVDSRVFELFSQYHWPGNVRELKNTLARALVLAPSGPITKNSISLGGSKPSASHVPETTENSFGKDRPAVSLSDQEFENAKQRFFQLNRQDQQVHLKAMFVEVCGRESGAVTYIAELTGISKETVRKQLKAAGAGKSGRSRPRQKAREDLIPKLQKYLIANV